MKVLLTIVCNFLDYLDADKFENIYSYYDMEPMKMKMTEIALFLSQIEITPKHFLEKKKKPVLNRTIWRVLQNGLMVFKIP